jgi:hypothetical protein
MSAGAAITIIFAEQFCVRREMREGLWTMYDEAESSRRHDETEEGRVLVEREGGGDGGRPEDAPGESIEMSGYPAR